MGYEIALREPSGDAPSLRWTPPIPVYEVREKLLPAQVIAEGKGLTHERSIASAVGEAVERILGSFPSAQVGIRSACFRELGIPDEEINAFDFGPRDCLHPLIVTDWVDAYEWCSEGCEPLFVPAELVFTSHIGGSRVAVVAYRNTTGLAAGRSVDEAVLNGLLEIIERDAYWIVMRCKMRTPTISLRDVQRLDPRVGELAINLERQGLRLHLQDISLDWPIPIVHAFLEDASGRVPAFAHGSGAALSISEAVTRAICEVVQVRSDLCRWVDTHLLDFVMPANPLRSPHLTWADPLWGPQLAHFRTSSRQARSVRTERTNAHVADLVAALRAELSVRGHRVLYCRLGEIGGIHGVRVFLLGATPPDPRGERVSPRMKRFLNIQGLSSPYIEPILT
ncbi:YcaO-like family protein [Longimicrobium sp.]|uniref:YcaO-like family protein n=1 Tax=Longimicrobium sp. TaxID=2029185 RepID=UPI0039C8C838